MSTMPGPFGPAFGNPLAYEARRDWADPGVLSRFFNGVYAWMAAGLGLTALVAWVVSTHTEILVRILNFPTLIALLVVQLALVMVVGNAVHRVRAGLATLLFLLYAAINGLTLSVIFLIYARSTIASAFVITAGTFGVMSVYGMVTKRDLTRFGSLLFMGLIGIVLASVVSLFWHNTMLQVAINYIGVLLFVGLTAYDTQRLKETAYATSDDPALAARLSISGALRLYLDFINLFLFILRTMSRRR